MGPLIFLKGLFLVSNRFIQSCFFRGIVVSCLSPILSVWFFLACIPFLCVVYEWWCSFGVFWRVILSYGLLWSPMASISFISLRSFPNGCKRLGSLSFPPFDSFVFEITSSLFPRIESTICFHFHSHFSKSLPISLISLQSLPLLCLIHFCRNQRVSFLWVSMGSFVL